MPVKPAPPRRAAGRPNRISRDQSVAAALRILQRDGLQGLSMGRVAAEMQVSPMAIYTYFRGRDELLDECADSIFRQLELPLPDLPWRAAVANWLEGLRVLTDRWPIALKLIKWEEHIAPAWLRTWLPMIRVLSRAGLEGERLAFASAFLSRSGMGLIAGHLQAPTPDDVDASVAASALSPDDRMLAIEVLARRNPERRMALFEFGVEAILNALDKLVAPQQDAGTGHPPVFRVVASDAEGALEQRDR